MEKLLATIAQGLVEHFEAVTVQVDEPPEDGNVVYHLYAAGDDMGWAVDKQGHIAKVTRVMTHVAATRTDDRVSVGID